MKDVTTIQLDKSVVRELKRIRRYPRETYNETITELIKEKETKKEFDRSVQMLQRPKMKELWDNKEDEVWNNA